jgi:hypothetical protein
MAEGNSSMMEHAEAGKIVATYTMYFYLTLRFRN